MRCSTHGDQKRPDRRNVYPPRLGTLSGRGAEARFPQQDLT